MNKLQKVKEALEMAEEIFNEMDALSWGDDSEWQHSSYDAASQVNMEALAELNEFMEGLESEEVKGRILNDWRGYLHRECIETGYEQVFDYMNMRLDILAQAAINVIKGE